MGSEYDSILKEKKKDKLELLTTDVDTSGPNYVIMCLIAVVVIFLISYVVYYNMVLSGKNIFFNDFKVIFDEYRIVVDNINFDYDVSNSYSFKGIINVNDGEDINKLDYSFINGENRSFFNIYNDDVSVKYYSDNSGDYVYYSDIIDKYVMIEESNKYKSVRLNDSVLDIINDFLSIKDNYKKSFYLDGDNPVVKVEVNLNRNEISNILGIRLEDEYNVNISLINHSFTNDIVSAKVIVNNKSKDTRDVYLYSDGKITHTNDKGINEKVSISSNDNDFILKYYRDDVLYSVLSGTNNGSVYNYLYQIIDSKYTVRLDVSDSRYLFDFNIDTESKKYDVGIDILLEYSSSSIIDEVVGEYVNKKELTKEEVSKYDILLKDILGFDLLDVIGIS